MQYISMELRLENLLRAIATKPKVSRLQPQRVKHCVEVLQDVANEFGRLEKRDGFKIPLRLLVSQAALPVPLVWKYPPEARQVLAAHPLHTPGHYQSVPRLLPSQLSRS